MYAHPLFFLASFSLSPSSILANPPLPLSFSLNPKPSLSKPAPSPPPPPPPNHHLPPQHPWDSQPITALSIYLSKIDLPDLQPKIKRDKTTTSGRTSPATNPPAAATTPAVVEEGRFGRLMDGFGRLGLGTLGGGGGSGGLRVGSSTSGSGRK